MGALYVQETFVNATEGHGSESMSYGELAELQDLAPHIADGDVELLEAAGVPEDVANEGAAAVGAWYREQVV